MIILAIDSSSLPLSVAVLRDGVILAEYSVCLSLTHSETLMPAVDQVIKRTGIGLNELDALAIAGGPGSFTGLRIGSAAVKGLGDALNIPVISVPTLEAMAYNISDCPHLIVPMLDARRGNVFAAVYEYDENEITPILSQCIISLKELLKRCSAYDRKAVFLGDGAVKYRDEIGESLMDTAVFAPPHLNFQRAGAVAVLSEKLFCQGKYTDAASHRPDYIKATQAEQERIEAERQGKLRELSAGGHSLFV